MASNQDSKKPTTNQGSSSTKPSKSPTSSAKKKQSSKTSSSKKAQSKQTSGAKKKQSSNTTSSKKVQPKQTSSAKKKQGTKAPSGSSKKVQPKQTSGAKNKQSSKTTSSKKVHPKKTTTAKKKKLENQTKVSNTDNQKRGNSKAKKVVAASSLTAAAAKKRSKTKDSEPDKIRPVKKSKTTRKPKTSGRKLNNLEVRNSHASMRKKAKKIKFVRTTKRSQDPLIYDEAKYLKNLKRSGKRNTKYIMMLFTFLFTLSLLFTLRLEITHTKSGQNLETYASNMYTETTSVDSTRGTIYDTNGEALAINLEVYDIKAITSADFECNTGGTYENCALEDAHEAAVAMTEALNLGDDAEAYIEERLQYGLDNGKYEISFGSYGTNVTLSQKKALEALEYPWLQFTAQDLRFYPYGDFASYIVGYTTKDDDGEINGALGVEKALDGYLKGQDGSITSSFDNYGIELTEAQQSAIPAIDGTDVYLTLDNVIQTYLENSMEKALSQDGVSDIEYDGLFTIVMDVETGGILAAQSYPTFDPNVREIENYMNFFTSYCFEPGSTFKAATVAAADEAGVWDENALEKTGSRSASTWGGFTVGDYNNQVGWGLTSWAQGFYFSSNTVMTYIMDEIPKDFWIEFVTEKLLIGTPVSTQFFETPSCVFNPVYDVEYATTSFGQGMTLNVLQLLRMYSALVNDGQMVTPHIVSEILDSDSGETIYTDDSLEVIEDVVSEETSQHIRELLRGVVDYDDGVNKGTGYNYLGSDYDIGMKTGTAQMVGDDGKYLENEYIYSTIAAAPIEDPQLLIFTAVIAPEDNKTNISYLAFPQYVKEVFDNSLSYLNSENREVDLDSENSTYRVQNYVGTDIDDVDASRIIKIGTGEVTSQYPKDGQELSTSQNTILFGTDNLEFPDVEGFTYNETVAICNKLDLTCEFTNTGSSVASYTNESENKYKIKME